MSYKLTPFQGNDSPFRDAKRCRDYKEMTMVLKTCRLHFFLFFGALSCILVGLAAETQAASKVKTNLTVNEARELLRSGYDALQAQKPQEAVAAFSQALKSGQLDRNEMARTFYYRGQAYRLLKQPAGAISDLNSAIWLKDALSKKDRDKALQMRNAAYQEAGIESSSSSSRTPSRTSSQVSSWQATASNTAESKTENTNAIASFFSDLFNTKKPAAGTQDSSDAASSASWSANTQTAVANVRLNKPVQTSAVASGAYIIQIASLRSAAKARTLARKIAREHSSLLRGREPEVESQIIGNMGVFYHVRIKKWPSKKASQGLCKKLLASGLDCLVTTG